MLRRWFASASGRCSPFASFFLQASSTCAHLMLSTHGASISWPSESSKSERQMFVTGSYCDEKPGDRWTHGLWKTA